MTVSVVTVICVIAITTLVLLVIKDAVAIVYGPAEFRFWHTMLAMIEAISALMFIVFLLLIWPKF